MRWYSILLGLVLWPTGGLAQVYDVVRGDVEFHSEAPQELIRASSDQLKGIVDLSKKSFAFKISIASFMGFNSPLQKEHFNENYMETNVFPDATFIGKIIEDVDLSKDGVHSVRAKGKLTIHGVSKERIIKSEIMIRKGEASLRSVFIVPLAEHNIKIPRVVSEKLAPDINVTVEAGLKRR